MRNKDLTSSLMQRTIKAADDCDAMRESGNMGSYMEACSLFETLQRQLQQAIGPLPIFKPSVRVEVEISQLGKQ